MMTKKTLIGSGQLFSMLIVLRLVIMLTADTILLGGENLMDNLLSCLIAFALNFILILPLYFLNKRGPGTNLLERSRALSTGFGAVIAIFYAIYFMGTDCYYLSFFHVFTANVLDPEIPSWLIATAVVAVAIYAAFKGVEAISRASGIILVIILLGLAFVFATLVPKIDAANFQPFLYHGPKQTIVGTLQFLSRSTGFATMALLMPKVSGNRRLGFTMWNLVVYGFMAIGITILVGALGSYVNTQLFPFYSGASVAGVGPFQRMDAAFIGMWVLGLFVKVAIDLYMVAMCFTQIFNKTVGRVAIVAGGVVVAGSAVLVSNFREAYQLFFSLKLLLPFTFAAAFLIPLVVLIGDCIKHKRSEAA